MNNIATIFLASLLFLSFGAFAQNVGIGTDDPTGNLHVVSSVEIAYPLNHNFDTQEYPLPNMGDHNWFYSSELTHNNSPFAVRCPSIPKSNETAILQFDYSVAKNRKVKVSIATYLSSTSSDFQINIRGKEFSSNMTETDGWKTLDFEFISGSDSDYIIIEIKSFANNVTPLMIIDDIKVEYETGHALKIQDGQQAEGKVLISDELGQAKWYNIRSDISNEIDNKHQDLTFSTSSNELSIEHGNTVKIQGLKNEYEKELSLIDSTITASPGISWHLPRTNPLKNYFHYDNLNGSVFWGVDPSTPMSKGYLSTRWGQGNKAEGFYSTAFGFNNVSQAIGTTTWGDSNLANGQYATSWGKNNTVSDSLSTSWGKDNSAVGKRSTTWGIGNNASGTNSTAWGEKNDVQNLNATAFGYGNSISGDNGFAIGRENTITENNSQTIGSYNHVTSNNSTAIGYSNEIYNTNAFTIGVDNILYEQNNLSLGKGNIIERANSIAIGRNNTLLGQESYAMGFGLKTRAAFEFVVGKYNETKTTSIYNVLDSEDIIFAVGNGLSDNSRSNAMTILRNGNMGIGEDASDPKSLLYVKNDDPNSETTLTVSNEEGNARLNIWSENYVDGFKSEISFASADGTGGCKMRFEDNETFRIFRGTNYDQFVVKLNSIGIENEDPFYKLHMGTNSAAKPGSSSWIVSSDRRLKKNITPFEGGLSTILQINPVSFNYNGEANLPEEETFIGTIAQELEKIAPFMVQEWEYQVSDRKSETYKAVDYGAMDFLLVNAIKEQQKTIEDANQKIEEAQAEIKELKRLVRLLLENNEKE